MPANSNQNTTNKDEIDLLDLFMKTGSFIKDAFLRLIDLITSILVFVLRKWYYFAIAVILTVISALVLQNISDPYYYSDLVLKSNATHNQPIMSNVDKLSDYAAAQNYTALSSDLNLSLEEASTIKGLKAYWYYDINDDGIFDGIDNEGRFLSDTNVVVVDSVFLIQATIYDPGMLQNLEEGLRQYLESNPFLNALNKQRLSNLKAQLQQTEYEIVKLDSLQKREYYTNTDQLRQQDGQIVFTSEKVIRMYHNDMFRLLQQKQECERDLNIYSGVVTVQESFSIPNKVENGTTHYAINLIWYYLGLALAIAVLVTFRKKIWIREKP